MSQLRTRSPRARDAKAAARIAALPDQALATPAEAAAFLGVGESTLRLWRRERRGPRFVMLEGRPRYQLADLKRVGGT